MNTDVIFIDEVSMLSLKTFKQLEKLFREVREVSAPFGGVQIVASGDFWQLKPVPNPRYNDPGQQLIDDPELLKTLLPHHFVLEKVHHQSEGIYILVCFVSLFFVFVSVNSLLISN